MGIPSLFKSKDKTRTQSSIAQRVASKHDVRQRRRTQRRRRFVRLLQSIGSHVLRRWDWLANLPWQSRTGGSQPRVRPHLPGFSGWNFSKVFSLILLVAIVSTIYELQESESFFVYEENVHFHGSQFLSEDELYEYCDVESWSVLWLDPDLIRSQIMENPYVADAQVQIQWPAQIDVTVTEVRPQALWVTDQGNYWLTDEGTALPARSTAPGEDPPPALPVRLVDPGLTALAPSPDGALQVSPQLIKTALDLTRTFGELDTVWYNSSHGLNFGIPGTETWVYWGDERHFDDKWLVLETLMSEIETNREEHRTLNVGAPKRPYFRYYDESPSS